MPNSHPSKLRWDEVDRVHATSVQKSVFMSYLGAASGTCLCTRYMRATVMSAMAITR
jgi:hypothetical protein